MTHGATTPGGRTVGRAAAVILLGILLFLGRSWTSDSVGSDPGSPEGEARVLELYEDGRSGEMVLVGGVVDTVLPDDLDGSRHQRFIIRLDSGHTLLVAHNIDLAARVPARSGDRLQVRGEYEWNDQGGVLHWTHDDPAGDHPGGWIEFDGTRYQ